MSSPSASRPQVLSLVGPDLRARLFSPDAEARLADLAEVRWVSSDDRWTSDRLATEIAGYDALITGWGSPKVTPEVLSAADRLKLVAHSAGSVKSLVDEDVLRQVKVSSAAIAMAPAVAEYTLTMIMLGLRHLHEYDYGMRRGGHAWDSQTQYGEPREIRGSTIGVVGAGGVGRLLIGMLTALGANVLVHDPYLPDADAAMMGATKVDLDTAMDAPIVTDTLPTTPETHHMIGAPQLAQMPENGLLINPGRSWTVDQDALLAALQGGRIRAALDVYDEEPLPLDHPFRALPNVILTPHIAGASAEGRYRQGDCVVRDLGHVLAGEPLAHEVTLERYAILA